MSWFRLGLGVGGLRSGASDWHHRPPRHTSRCSAPTEDVPLWVYVFITGVAISLVGSAILLTLCMTWRLSGKGLDKGPDRVFLRHRNK